MLDQAKKKGIDTDALLAETNIETSRIGHQNARIETEKIAILIQAMWQAMQDENLGLSQHKCNPGTFYMMGKLTIHQPNLEKVLKLGLRFYNQFVSDYTLSLVSCDDKILLKVEQKDLHLDPEHLLTELLLMAWHRYSSWLINQNIPIYETLFNFSKPQHVDEYKFIFPSQHRFNQSYSGFSFHKQYLVRPIVQNEVTLKAFMLRCPSAFFLKHDVDQSVSSQIRQQIENHVSSGLPHIDTVAKTLSMTSQTLRRKLKAEGTSYQQIKDLIRRDSALYYLTQLNSPISEVARLTGFSETSVFIRAFKKWTGSSPASYRNNQNRK